MAAHRYWRYYVRYCTDSTYTLCAEFQLRVASGGATVTGSGTPIASGQTGLSEQKAYAFDGNTGTYWQTASGSQGAWLGYDFGAGNEKDIIEVALQCLSGYASRMPLEADVQYSDDGSAWTTSWSWSFTGWTNSQQVFTKPSAAASRYWRIRPFKTFNGSDSGFGIAEIEMKETVGGTDATGSGTASARTTFSGFPASNAFDNSSSTLYSHNAAVSQSDWVQYDFGSGVTKSIVEVTLLPRNDSYWAQAPTSAYVESSADGVSFLERFRFTGAVGGPGYTMRAIAPAFLPTPPSGKHRFWGIRANSVQSGSANGPFGVGEIELRATVGGAKINTGGRGGAALHPYTADNTSGSPTSAYDGNTSTAYASNGSNMPDIVAYDFDIGNEKSGPQQLKIRARASPSQTQSPTAFDLVYSDEGQTWTSVQSYTSPATWASGEERLFGGVVAAVRRRSLVNC